ncbi:hypothetical protein [Streptomyces sp. NPDC048606]|uniref:hypothetical protein n=1 Tax=Streptomyces sp. NPDC048606 TaxID=3154726 RepID=UPI00341FBE30
MLVFYPSRLSLVLNNSSALFDRAAVTGFMKRMHELLESEEAYEDFDELTPEKVEAIVREYGDHIGCRQVPLNAITSVNARTRMLRDPVVTVEVDTALVPAGIEIEWPLRFRCDQATANRLAYRLRCLGCPRQR